MEGYLGRGMKGMAGGAWLLQGQGGRPMALLASAPATPPFPLPSGGQFLRASAEVGGQGPRTHPGTLVAAMCLLSLFPHL